VGTLQVKVPDAILAQAKALRDDGVPWRTISKKFGIHPDTLRRRLDPQFRLDSAKAKTEYSRAAFNVIRRGLAAYSNCVGKPPLNNDELRARLSLIPPDTRDLTARICGDPIPGDRRRA
jgi:hypothetical protein